MYEINSLAFENCAIRFGIWGSLLKLGLDLQRLFQNLFLDLA